MNAKDRLQLLIPGDETDAVFFERVKWPNNKPACPRCNSTKVRRVKHRGRSECRCKECRSYFTVRTGTAMARSNLSLTTWARAVYWLSTTPMERGTLHEDLGVQWNTAALIARRIRKACGVDAHEITASQGRGRPRSVTGQLNLTTMEIRERMLR